MHLKASGEARVCCLRPGWSVTQDGVTMSADRQPLMEIWNADTMREVRRAMVEGRRVAGCEMCYVAEDRGGESIRQFDNKSWERDLFGGPNATIDELMALAVDNDFRLPKLPQLIDCQSSSICNLKCRMCNSNNSSRIAKDVVHRSWEPEDYLTPEDPTFKWTRSVKNLEHELANDTGSEVRRINFAGGEPFLLREIPRLLERLIAIGRAPFLSMQFVSNGSVVPRWLALAEQFRRFDLLISVDGYADDYDYIRYPGRWSKLANHFQLFKTMPGICLLATTTIQVNNVLRLTDLFRYLDSVDINFVGYLLHHPRQLAVSILPASVRRVAAARLLEYAEADCRPHQRALVLSFAAQIEAGDEAGDPDRLRDFMLFTNDLDISRGQSIRLTDPELVGLLEQAGFPWLDETRHAPADAAAPARHRRRRAPMESYSANIASQREPDATGESLRDELTQTRDRLRMTEEQARSRSEEAPIRDADAGRLGIELDQVHASRFWRVARPFRAAGRMLGRWKQGRDPLRRPDTR